MASPGEFKGQRKGSCGHIMAAFDNHEKCARCRDKKVGQDPCVICDGFSDIQREKLATPSYKIRKERKAGVLVSPKEVTVLGSLDTEEQAFDTSAQVSAQPSVSASPASSQPQSFVTAKQFEAMNNSSLLVSRLCCQGETSLQHQGLQFLRSLLNSLVSAQPFINPSARHTDPVVLPADKGSDIGVDSKPQPRVHKSSMADKTIPDQGPQVSLTSSPVLIPGSGDDPQEPFFQPVQSSVEPFATGLEPSTDLKQDSTGPTPSVSRSQKRTGQDISSTGHVEPAPYPPAAASGASFVVTDPSYRDLPPQELYEELSGEEDESTAEEGEASSEVIDRQDQTEDMTYRETVRSVRSFMGWSHIPVYESDLSEPDKSNNPWKGKNPKKPARISVAMPPDDWLCQKLEKLNTTVAEGYPSRAQDSGPRIQRV